jgi:hypothetical protein
MRTKRPNDRASVKSKRDRESPAPSQNQPKPAKKPFTTVPPPQAARIVSRFIAGESIREIARAEQRDRSTIARIVRCEDVQLYIAGLRGNYLDLGPDAISALRRGLKNSKDGRLAHEVLHNISAIPSERERHRLVSSESQLGNTELDERRQSFEQVIEVLANEARNRGRT